VTRFLRFSVPIALVALGGLFLIERGLEGQGQSQGQGKGSTSVTIVGPLPVPTTGTSTVSGTVAATQSGPWNVGISGAPNVNVLNTPLPTREVDIAREPVNFMFFCGPTSDTGCNVPTPYKVPAGKRLIIEYVSLAAENLPVGDAAYVSITTIAGGQGAFFFLPPPPLVLHGSSINSQSVRLYADPLSSVSMQANRLSAAGGGPATLYIMSYAGYLVPVP